MKTMLSAVAVLIVILFAAFQATPAKAWDCSRYVFSVTGNGTVTVVNDSGNNEPAQLVDVFVDTILVSTFPVPALTAHSAPVVLGAISLPAGTHTWDVIGTEDCRNNGTFTITVPPTVTPPPNVPPPPGQTLVCVTIDKGDLWGKLEIWHSNEAGDRLNGFDGYAEINADGALTVFANPGESRQGWFLVIDEHGTQALFYIEIGMVMDCASPLNHDCRRIYPEPLDRDHPCNCEK